MLLNGPGFVAFTTLSVMAGMVAFAYYDMKGCDPLAAGLISNGNQVSEAKYQCLLLSGNDDMKYWQLGVFSEEYFMLLSSSVTTQTVKRPSNI